MEFIIMYIIIITISIFLKQILKGKIEEVIPIATIGMTLLIYIAGLLDNLKAGVYAVILIYIIITIYLLITQNRLKNNEKKIKIFKEIITPGFVIFTVLYIIYVLISQNKIFTHYDEFSHWGTLVKNMYIYNNFGTTPETLIQYNEYPPFAGAFEYIFLIIKGNYTESTVIAASKILYLSIIILIFRNITWKTDKKLIIIYTLGIIFLPMVFYTDFYDNILVDGLEGIFFAISLYSWYSIRNKKNRNIIVTCLLIALGLLKLSGIGLVIIVLLIILIDTLIKKKNRKEIINVLLIILLISVFILAWFIKINISGANKKWKMENINTENIREIENNYVQKDIIERFIKTIFFDKVLTPINLTYIECLALIVALGIIVYKTQGKIKRKEYIYYEISIFGGTIIYTISLLLTYLFIIPEIESTQIASYERYVGTIILGNIMFLFSIVVNKKMKISKSKLVIILCICSIIFPINNIIIRLTDKDNEIEKEILNRRYISQIVEYKDKLTEEDKIYYFSNEGSEAKKKLYIARYIMMPIKIGNIEIEIKEELKKKLKEEKYTHIYLFELTEEAKEAYKKMFPESKIKEKTMYKIENEDNGEMKLIEEK